MSLSLPEKLFTPHALYGSVKYTGRLLNQINNRKVLWSHGWSPSWNKCVPEMGITVNLEKFSDRTLLVGNLEHETLLRASGFRAINIGLPFAYAVHEITKHPPVTREFDLYIPNHGTIMDNDYSSIHIVNIAREIKVRSNKLKVLVDSHRYNHTDLCHDLSKVGIDSIQGIELNDINGLERLAWIFHSTDTVYIDGFGSHIAYAAACGAYINSDFYSADPYVLNGPLVPYSAEKIEMLNNIASIQSIRANFDNLDTREKSCVRGYSEIGFDTCNEIVLRRLMLSDPSSVIRNLKMELGIRRRRREHIDSTTGSHVDTNFQSNLESALKTFASSFGDLILDVVKHKSRPYWRKIKRDDVCGTCRLLSSWITDSPQGVTTLPICERCCVEVFERSVKFNNHCPLYVYFVLRYSDPISLLDKFRCMASQVQFHTFTESSLNGESAIIVIGRITRRW